MRGSSHWTGDDYGNQLLLVDFAFGAAFFLLAVAFFALDFFAVDVFADFFGDFFGAALAFGVAVTLAATAPAALALLAVDFLAPPRFRPCFLVDFGAGVAEVSDGSGAGDAGFSAPFGSSSVTMPTSRT